MDRWEAIDLSRELHVYRQRLEQIEKLVNGAWPQARPPFNQLDDKYAACHIGEVKTALDLCRLGAALGVRRAGSVDGD
jgi:hypothetical protein